MTATQVFNRFIRNYEYYWIKPVIKDLVKDIIEKEESFSNHIGRYDSLKKHFKKEKKPPVDLLLKYYRTCLQSLLTELWWRNGGRIINSKKYSITKDMFDKMRSDFQIFLKENVDGGYKKYYITDTEKEFRYGHREGHYFVDFKYKNGKN